MTYLSEEQIRKHGGNDEGMQSTLRHIFGDPNSPARRLEDYHRELTLRGLRRAEYICWLPMYGLAVIWRMQGVLTFDSFWVIPSMLLVIMLAGDVYDTVRDLIERWWFCPRYDKASQPKPEFDVPEPGLGPFRFLIYLGMAPLLPMAVLMLCSYCDLIKWMSYQDAWKMAVALIGLLGVLRLDPQQRLPASVRAFCKPFRRLPSPDVN
jgi:hypothetical protein